MQLVIGFAVATANERLRKLPKIDELITHRAFDALNVPRWALLDAARTEVEAKRAAILAGHDSEPDVDLAAIAGHARRLAAGSLRSVINATGVVLHTNLGRAPVAESAIEHVADVCRGYSNLEYDLEAGQRGSRHGHVAGALVALTGAEDGLCVNNNAGAVMLGLAALAVDREVVVSRGELVEIGGSFRIPDIMRWSLATLVEVGTTNRTRLADYEQAICDETALLLKVHQSNFSIVGFTAEVSPAELATLGRERGVTTMMDLGSGSFLDSQALGRLGLAREPSVREVLAAGVDVVTFSGDKLLGGPQAGLIVGRREHIAKMRSHPLMRVLRPDRMTIAAVEATLAVYRAQAVEEIPIVAMLGLSAETLRERATSVCQAVGDVSSWADMAIRPCESAVGGGAMPAVTLSSWAIAIVPRTESLQHVQKRFRESQTPTIGRIVDDAVMLDMRTVAMQDMDLLTAVIRQLADAPSQKM